MNYKEVIAYKPNLSVLFELEDGKHALVAINENPKDTVIEVAVHAESFLKFGYFEDAKYIPDEHLQKAIDILKHGEKIYYHNGINEDKLRQ